MIERPVLVIQRLVFVIKRSFIGDQEACIGDREASIGDREACNGDQEACIGEPPITNRETSGRRHLLVKLLLLFSRSISLRLKIVSYYDVSCLSFFLSFFLSNAFFVRL